MGVLNIGRVRPVLRGTWSAATADYVAMDWVSYNGTGYIALQAVPTNTVPDSDPAYWDPVAQKGDTGAAGATGATGSQGTAGATGATGSQGVQGDAGVQGPQGTAGTNGTNGSDGATGAVGPATDHQWVSTTIRFQNPDLSWPVSYVDLIGPQGNTGSQGVQGVQGDAGNDGATGATGAQGTQGATGATGPQGIQGVQGDAGPTGPAGTTLWSGITGVPSTFAPSAHGHAISDITSLQSSLDGKLGTGAKAADSEKVDGINGASLLRSDVDDNLTAAIIVPTGNRDEGMFGTYDSTKTQHIWSMGTAYRNSASGANFGGLYGLAYKHTNNGTGGTMAVGHMMVWCQGGGATAALGTNIWTSGNVTAYSDIRVKTNIELIPNALDKVCALGGYTYDRTDTDLPRQTGVIAQEVLAVLPEAVTGGPTEDDPEGHYSVAYGNLVGLLIEAVKELKGELDELRVQGNQTQRA